MTSQVVAYSPHELMAAQSTVRGWCAENIRRLLAERKEAEANLAQAKQSKWRTAPFSTLVSRCGKRIEFYKKIGKAIKLGYMIVPNFDMDLFAVRTKRFAPRQREHQWRNQFIENGDVLPEGEGRYVGNKPEESFYLATEKNRDGKDIEVNRYYPVAFMETIAFPISFVKPQIIAETSKAMGYKLFDQVGVVRGGYVMRKDDPIIAARILDGSQKGKAVTFFVAWWLDKDML